MSPEQHTNPEPQTPPQPQVATGRLHARVDALRRLPAQARVNAFAGALDIAPPDERAALATELIEIASIATSEGKHTPPARIAMRALLRHWRAVPEEFRTAASAAGSAEWSSTFEECTEPADLEGALAAACEIRATALADSLVPTLAHDDPRLAASAARALLLTTLDTIGIETEPEFLEGLLDTDAAMSDLSSLEPSRHPVRRDPEEIATAIAEACWRFAEHRQRDPLRAALLLVGAGAHDLGDASARLSTLVESTSHPAASALKGELRWSRAPLMRRIALTLLSNRSLRQACLDRVSAAETTAEHEAMLAAAHLAITPTRRAAIATCKAKVRMRQQPRDAQSAEPTTPNGSIAPGGILPTPQQASCLSPAARRGLVTWIDTMRMPAFARAAAAEPALLDSEPAVRFAAARVARGPDLLDHTFDEDERIASHAATRWTADHIRRATSDADLSPLRRSPHRRVRELALAARPIIDARSPAAPALAARRRALADRTSVVDETLSRITSAPQPDAIDALNLARRVGLTHDIAPALADFVRAAEPQSRARVVASAVLVLADADDDSSHRAVLFCLSHRDQRVRANAIEALAKRARRDAAHARDLPDILVELKDDDHHRVRANAIRALVDVAQSSQASEAPEIGASLGSLLESKQPVARRAGLWALQRIAPRLHDPTTGSRGEAIDELARFVERLASDDEDDAVRGRASLCSQRLNRDQRSRWAGAAPSLDEPSTGFYTGYEGAPPPKGARP